MKILFDHPNPFQLAHGGFQIQIEQTKNSLENIGCEVDWLRWWDENQRADLIHYFGRPHPDLVLQCKAKGMKMVMSELLTGQASRPFWARLLQKVFIAVARRTLPRDFTSRLSWNSYQKVNAAIALTEWEKKLMVQLFAAPPDRVHVVPNGVEDLFLQDTSGRQREDHFICTATITPRKRVVELALAATLARVKVRFFGRPYSSGDYYFREFLAAVGASGGWAEYCDAISDREQLAREYRLAKGFVLISSMESQSLSALEAAACGCPLLLSDLPWAKVSFGTQASYAPLASPEATAPFLKKFDETINEAPRVQRVLRWIEVAKQLKGIYREAMTSR